MKRIKTMRGKVLLVIIAMVLVVGVILTVLFYRRSAAMISSNYEELQYDGIRQIGNSLDTYGQEIYLNHARAASSKALAADLTSYLDGESEEALETLIADLREEASRCSEIGLVCLVLPEEGIVITSRDYPAFKMIADDTLMKTMENAAADSMIPQQMENPVNAGSNLLAYVSAMYNDDGVVTAYLIHGMEERSLYYTYLDDAVSGDTASIVLLDGKYRIISSEEQSEIGTAYEDDSTKTAASGGVLTGENGKIGMIYHATFTDTYLVVEIDRQEVLASLRSLRIFLLLLLAAAFCVAVFLSALITKSMVRPLRQLTDAMVRVGEGDLEQQVTVESADEIGILSARFNDMMRHMQELIGQIVNEEMQKKNAELDALQYQITPHFMYNTLNSIKYMAILNGEEKIGKLLEDFIELLQASINKRGTFVTVAEEIYLVQSYMNLQNIRYEEAIEMVYEVDPQAESAFLPRLMLQSLVENAILHGLDLKEGRNRITITARILGGDLWIAVKDSGRGMSEEQIRQLLSSKEKKTRGLSGIGVANVRERLELYYGEAAALSYESSENGTTALIHLPYTVDPDQYAL